MEGNAPRSVITSVPGWETEAEQRYLVELAKTVPADGLIVEIGAEWGQSASLWSYTMMGLPHGSSVDIVSIDTFQGDMLGAHQRNLAEAGFNGRTKQIVGDSKLVGEGWGSPIDLLFIDGDHSYAGAKSDIQLFTPHVKVGGLVVFHDVAQVTNLMPHHLHFEVTRALSEWQQAEGGDWEPLRPVDTTAVFRRVKAPQGQGTADSEPDDDLPTQTEIGGSGDESHAGDFDVSDTDDETLPPADQPTEIDTSEHDDPADTLPIPPRKAGRPKKQK